MRLLNAHPFLLVLCAFPLYAGCGSGPATAQRTTSNAPAQVRIIEEPKPALIEEVRATAKPDAQALVAAYNSRNLGSPGQRGVTLELIDNNKVTRSFTVYNFWKQERGEVRTLFLLKEPRGLSGTSYLLIENGAFMPDMKVHLFLPSGERRVLGVASSNFDEGLLGSDFTYSDMRMQLPTQGYRYRVAGQSVLLNDPTWVLEAEQISPAAQPAGAWGLTRFYLARDFPFLLGAEYYATSDDGKINARPAKQMRVESYRQINDVWTADKIVMYSADNRASVLILKDAHFGLPQLADRLFTPEQLPSLGEDVRQGRFSEAPSASRATAASASAADGAHTSGTIK